MKIAFVTTDFSASLWVLKIAKHLLNENIKVLAFLNRRSVEGAEIDFELFGIDVSTVGIASFGEILQGTEVFRKVLRKILSFRPSVIVFADSPDFNIPLAFFLRRLLKRTRFVYFIPPPVWIWRSERKFLVDAFFDKLLCVFPNEVEVWGEKAEWVGHPVVSEILRVRKGRKPKHFLAVLPGSREQEVKEHIEVVRKVCEILKTDDVAVPTPFPDFVKDNLPFAKVFPSKLSVEVMNSSFACVVASGTASLEAVLLGKPTCVFYWAPLKTILLGKALKKLGYIRANWISLPNILLDRRVVPEVWGNEKGKLAVKISQSLWRVSKDEVEYAQNELLKKLKPADFLQIAQTIKNFCEA